MKSVVIDKMMRNILLAHIFKDCLETKISNNNNNNNNTKNNKLPNFKLSRTLIHQKLIINVFSVYINRVIRNKASVNVIAEVCQFSYIPIYQYKLISIKQYVHHLK